MANSNGDNINQWTGQPYPEKRKKLPIWQHRDEFLNAFRANQVLALVAQTGSGKSTQVINSFLFSFLALISFESYYMALSDPNYSVCVCVFFL
jgi:HrpA-like RNA helicase